MKILSIGNSFSVDTMEHIADIMKSLGAADFKFGNLYIGGCSINRHYNNAVCNLADYIYYTNTADEWIQREGVAIEDAIKEEDWDIISIQHGTGDKSRYTSPQSYEKLVLLIDCIKGLAGASVKIAFNMAWVAEPESTHHEIASYGGNQLLMYEKITALTESIVKPLVDFVCPTGTAVQNARAYIPQKLTRDNFHLSYGLGRYIGGLSFLKTLCDIDVEAVCWRPDGVSDFEMDISKKAVNAAATTTFAVSEL